MNRHLASGSFLGYLFQIERALFWLSISDIVMIGLETEDDIVAEFTASENYKKVLEQAKSKTSSGYAFSNKSEDLWKTLHIWLEGVKDGSIDLSDTLFSIVSNKPLPSNRIIRKIVEAKTDEELNQLIDELIDLANNPSRKIELYCKTVIESDRETLIGLFKNISIQNSEDSLNTADLKRHVRSNLGISESKPFNGIYDTLIGFVTNQAIESWKCGEEFTLSREDLLKKSNELISTYEKKSFYEKTADSIPLEESEIEKNKRGAIFVKQLEVIGCDEEEKFVAINDYLKAKSEKTRYADDGEITEAKFNEYYEDLRRNWSKVFKAEIRFNKDMNDEDLGYSVYVKTTNYRGKLNGYEPDQSYTYNGAYHYLANTPEIGWIKNWEDLFKN